MMFMLVVSSFTKAALLQQPKKNRYTFASLHLASPSPRDAQMQKMSQYLDG